MRNRLRPLLFDDESDSTEDGQGRDSEVQPEKSALLEAQRTAQGKPFHGFRTALDDLAAVCCNTIEPNYLRGRGRG